MATSVIHLCRTERRAWMRFARISKISGDADRIGESLEWARLMHRHVMELRRVG